MCDETRRVTLNHYKSTINLINDLEDSLKMYSDLQLKNKTNELRNRLIRWQTIFRTRDGIPKDFSTPLLPIGIYPREYLPEDLITESFALIREASKRVLGLRHFDIQILGGLVLSQGYIAEMQTGEGKTIVALLPTFLKALYSKGTHVITINDYLVQRDFRYVGKVHTFLGLSVGLIQESMELKERKQNYDCDIVYLTNNELGFDYLRDNLAFSLQETVQRQFFYGVLDEVDSILIDEATTPLIISRPYENEEPKKKYLQTTKLVTRLKKHLHYRINEKDQLVLLTPEGVFFCEKTLDIFDLYNENECWIFYVLNSLRAKELFHKDKNYIINNDKIIIIDEFTGRTMTGRRWSNGLHQAIEAKESLPIQSESQIVASISYQHLFLLYEQLIGMTGTAKTGELEFRSFYNLSIISIPTHKPVKRIDFPDRIYRTDYSKWYSIGKVCCYTYKRHQPMLIGTTTIEKSEVVATLLSQYNIPYRLLNARPEYIENEAEIIAQAGCKKSVTIATNMAGRGTDIKLGGNPYFFTTHLIMDIFSSPNYKNNILIKNLINCRSLVKNSHLLKNLKICCINLVKKSITELQNHSDSTTHLYLKIYNSILTTQKSKSFLQYSRVKNLGGLYVIGTEHHQSRRIDDQLRGRAGRQGDPGLSRFFICNDDMIFITSGSMDLQKFGNFFLSRSLSSLTENALWNKDYQRAYDINHEIADLEALTPSSVENSQHIVELNKFSIRQRLFDYDQLLNDQRNLIYSERQRLFENKNVATYTRDYIESTFMDVIYVLTILESDYLACRLCFGTIVPTYFFCKQGKLIQQIEITNELIRTTRKLIQKYPANKKYDILKKIDNSWKKHLKQLSYLQENSNWTAGYLKALVQYKRESFTYFNRILFKLKYNLVAQQFEHINLLQTEKSSLTTV